MYLFVNLYWHTNIGKKTREFSTEVKELMISLYTESHRVCEITRKNVNQTSVHRIMMFLIIIWSVIRWKTNKKVEYQNLWRSVIPQIRQACQIEQRDVTLMHSLMKTETHQCRSQLFSTIYIKTDTSVVREVNRLKQISWCRENGYWIYEIIGGIMLFFRMRLWLALIKRFWRMVYG